jgi:hypothetical protein
MVTGSKGLLREHLAAASIAFGFILLVDQILSAYYGYPISALMDLIANETLFAFTGLHTIGGFLSGYLLGRRTTGKSNQAAILTAVIAYAFESIYYQFFRGKFEGVWSLMGLVVGGLFGAMFARVQIAKRSRASKGAD